MLCVCKQNNLIKHCRYCGYFGRKSYAYVVFPWLCRDTGKPGISRHCRDTDLKMMSLKLCYIPYGMGAWNANDCMQNAFWEVESQFLISWILLEFKASLQSNSTDATVDCPTVLKTVSDSHILPWPQIPAHLSTTCQNEMSIFYFHFTSKFTLINR